MKNTPSVAKSFITLFAVLFFAVSTAHAKIDLEVYGNLPKVQLVAISPDGSLMAYRNTDGGKDALVIYSFAKNELIDALGLSVTLDPTEIYFATNNELIMVTGSRLVGTDYRKSTAFVYNVKKKSIRELLKPGTPIVNQLDMARVVGVSPDKKYAYMLALTQGGVSIDTEKARTSLMRVKLKTTKVRKIHFIGSTNTIDIFPGKDGKALVHELYNDFDNTHSIEVKKGKKWVEIYKKKTPVREIAVLGVSPDYNALVLFKYDENTGLKSYYTMSLEDGSLQRSEVLRADTDIDDVIMDLNRVVYGAQFAGFNPKYKFLDKGLQSRVDQILKTFEGNSVWIKDWTDDFEKLLVYVEGSAYSGEYYLVPKKGKPVFLVASRPDVDYKAIHPVAKFSYKAEDGFNIPALLTIPRDKVQSLKNLPAVMLPHGGPEAYDQIGFDWMAQAFADQGYLVIQPQFRGSAGFGVQHRNAGYGEWGGKMITDINAGVGALTKKGYIDPKKVCIVGMSYGGYAALAGGAFTPDLYQCVVSINGVSDLNAMIYSEKYQHGYDSWVVSYFNHYMVSEDEGSKKKLLKKISPIRYADQFKAPVLLIHAEQDKQVRIDQSTDMKKALKSKGKAVKFVELKDETHDLVFGKTRAQALRETVNFVNQYLGSPK